ncbi:MAG: non-hydrolyzing UDP-N-acetylglucosamine 2-epimerase [Gemmatimonadaceae bacterium]
MRVLTVIGARPQFIKAAIVSRALRNANVEELLVHTGQHYDDRLSDVFFRELGLSAPTFHLGVGSGTHGVQTGRMISEIERVVEAERPDRVLVFGDTNSTLAGAIAASKLQVAVDHVEAGLRSFDRDMPEEVNRVVTDHLADQLFCPTKTSVDQLGREGITEGVLLVGDVMLDLAIETREPASRTPLPDGIQPGEYFVATIHRPSNTDDPQRLSTILETLDAVGRQVAPVVLPIHPRLAVALGSRPLGMGVRRVEPVGYLEMQGLILRARGVLTDSGGLQKEALFHGVPCVTLRDTTEWPESVEAGLNVLAGDRLQDVPSLAASFDGQRAIPETVLATFGGGRAGARIAEAVRSAESVRRRWRT